MRGLKMKEYNIKQNKTVGKFRLPTIPELLSLVDYTKSNPASNEDIASYYYWSSTTYASSTKSAWSVGFYYGSSGRGPKTHSKHVRCVRDTPDGLEWSKDAPTEMTWDEAMEYAESLEAEDLI